MKYNNLMVADFELLKSLRTHCSEKFLRLKQEAERELKEGVYKEHPKKSITFMGLYMLNQALMYRLTLNEKYLTCAEDWMNAVVSYPHWGNDSKFDIDLSASWVLFGLSVCYDWLSEYLSNEKKKKYIETITLHLSIFVDYVQSTQGHGWATEYCQNHNWINMTGIAAAGYLLKRNGLDDKNAIAITNDNFKKVFTLLADDGSNYEGCSYWRYGGAWLFYAAYLIRGEGGADYFKTSDYLKNTFFYRLYQTNPDLSRQLNFGDTHDLYSSHSAAIYYLIAHEYNNGFAQKLGNLVLRSFFKCEVSKSKVHPGLLPEAGLEYLFYDPNIEEEDFSLLPLYREFPDLGLVSIRSSWKKDAVVFSTKCGYPGGKKQWTKGWQINYSHPGWQVLSLSHNHPDNLSFQLVLGPRYFIADDGYNRNIMPFNHCVPLVDGKYADAEGVNDVYLTSVATRIRDNINYQPDKEYFGTISTLSITNGIYTVIENNTRIYPLNLKMTQVKRIFITDCKNFLFIVTKLVSDLPHIYEIITNTFDVPQKINDSKYVFENDKINCEIISDNRFVSKLETHTVETIMTPQEPNKKCHVQQMCLIAQDEEKVKEQVFGQLLSFNSIWGNLSQENNIWSFYVDKKQYKLLVNPITDNIKEM